MKFVDVLKSGKAVFADSKAVQETLIKDALTALDERKAGGKLTLEDIYEQGQIIIKLLQGMK